MIFLDLDLKPLYSSLIATMAFGIIFNVPKKTITSGGIIGMLGWSIYTWLIDVLKYEMVSATLVAAFFVANFSQVLARYHKIPVTVFSISGIIPLVPGGLAYDTMRNFVENDYLTGVRLGTKTLLISGAIAFGLIISGVISQTIRGKERNYVKES
ncbi:hypothetical protein BHF71_05255 [Vulcanibacillus modesticaldus]|uniref:Threonine/Serine exporter ThrE domain-containing protein n=1 Tax=Vulcanibacillus modesticaldus TaxID=337097 RepID=A0A1D2YX63_9BACI|nr:threonine/serine exporter family protein [Vulcanibacillus modesticaldus]OEG00309.1 hypothetical protein BHF71_05255 [Vulcanibacillus modesticaldus]